MRKFKILFVSPASYFSRSSVALLQQHPDLFQQPYDVQSSLLIEHKLVHHTGFSHAMSQLGHHVATVLPNIHSLQKQWAQENSVSYSETTWGTEILLAQIESIRPEIIYFQDYPPLPFAVWKNLKQTNPYIKKIIVHRGFPGYFDTLGFVDLLMVATRHLVTQYANYGITARLLYHYFDEKVLDSIQLSPVSYPITFVGSSGYSFGAGHATRYWLLKELLECTPIEMWLEETPPSKEASSKNPLLSSKLFIVNSITKFLSWIPFPIRQMLINSKWIPKKYRDLFNTSQYHSWRIGLKSNLGINLKEPEKPLMDLFPRQCHLPVFGLDYYRILGSSQISFNCHTDAALGDVGNMRMFEVTGMGSCLLTDTGKNMSDLFDVDSEVVTYSSREEALEKIKFLLEHESKCRDIATAGHQRTLRDHTVLKRCEQIDEWLQEII